MRPIGIILMIIGGFLMFHYYQESQTFAAKFHQAIGNTAATRGIAIDGIAGFVLALVGGGLFARGGK